MLFFYCSLVFVYCTLSVSIYGMQGETATGPITIGNTEISILQSKQMGTTYEHWIKICDTTKESKIFIPLDRSPSTYRQGYGLSQQAYIFLPIQRLPSGKYCTHAYTHPDADIIDAKYIQFWFNKGEEEKTTVAFGNSSFTLQTSEELKSGDVSYCTSYPLTLVHPFLQFKKKLFQNTTPQLFTHLTPTRSAAWHAGDIIAEEKWDNLRPFVAELLDFSKKNSLSSTTLHSHSTTLKRPLDWAVALRYMMGPTEERIYQNCCSVLDHAAIEAIEKSCGFLPDGREVVISPAGGIYIKQQEKRRWLRTTIGPSKGIIMCPNPELCASILKDIADVTADNYNTLAERVHHRAREILYKNFENVLINEEAIVRVSKGTCQNEKYTRVINYWPYNNNSKQASRTVVLSCSDDDPWLMRDVSIHGSYIYVLEAHHILSGKRHSFISKKNASNLAEQRLSRYTKSVFSGCNHDLAKYN
jgi:hypothetical protein